MNAGFLYVLINASMPGVVKVGKTERDPESRAKELSGVTGVPTPFVVVYQEYFDDCSAAEEFVHALLEEDGYRVATNREFFSAPPQVTIQAVIKAKAALGGKGTGEQPLTAAVPSESPDIPQSEPWEGILASADAAYLGSGDTIQDLDEAARLYQQAARLGSALACLDLADLYMNDDFQDANEDVAITWLKEGGRRGNAACYGRLARVYLQRGHTENAAKCWRRFCEGSEGHEDFETWRQCYEYLLTMAEKKTNIADFDWFVQRGDQIIRLGEKHVEVAREFGDHPGFCEARLCLIRYLLDPDAPVLRSKGVVKWWNDEAGGAGLVTTVSGQDAYVTAKQIVEGKLPPIVGQPVDFVLVQGEERPLACAVRLLRGSRSREDLKDLFKEEASEVARTIGLTSAQLLEARTYPLSDKDWRSMVMMPASFFPRAWKQAEEKGNAAQMMMIAAVLARVIGDGFARESPIVQRLMQDRPRFWEYSLTVELLKPQISELSRSLDEACAGMRCRKSRSMNLEEYFRWSQAQLDDLMRLLQIMTSALEDGFPSAWGSPGEPGDAVEIKRVVESFVGAGKGLVEWEAERASVIPPEPLKKAHNLRTGWAKEMFLSFRNIPAEMERLIGVPGDHEIVLRVRPPDFGPFKEEMTRALHAG